MYGSSNCDCVAKECIIDSEAVLIGEATAAAAAATRDCSQDRMQNHIAGLNSDSLKHIALVRRDGIGK